MHQERDPKAELKNCGMFALKSIGLSLVGAVMLVLSMAFDRVYPVVALVSGAMVLFGGLGVVLAILMAVFWLFKLRSKESDSDSAVRPDPRDEPQFDLDAEFRPDPRSALPVEHQRWIYNNARARRRNLHQASTPAPHLTPSEPVMPPPPPRQDPPLQHQHQIPRREMPPRQQVPPSQQTPPNRPSVTPPAVASAPPMPPPRQDLPISLDEQPTILPPSATPRPYRTWTTEALLERRQGIDGAAMGFAFQNLEIPEELTQELNAINAELSRRESLG